MPGKICPIYSAAEAQRECMGESCMLYMTSPTAGGACGLVRTPQQLASRIDTLSAQIQEIQVALIKLTGA